MRREGPPVWTPLKSPGTLESESHGVLGAAQVREGSLLLSPQANARLNVTRRFPGAVGAGLGDGAAAGRGGAKGDTEGAQEAQVRPSCGEIGHGHQYPAPRVQLPPAPGERLRGLPAATWVHPEFRLPSCPVHSGPGGLSLAFAVSRVSGPLALSSMSPEEGRAKVISPQNAYTSEQPGAEQRLSGFGEGGVVSPLRVSECKSHI